MRSVAVVPGEVERQLVLECGEAVRDQDQTSRALGFECSHASLDHRQAPIFSHGPEPVLDAVALTPPSESLLNELNALVGDKLKRLVACASEKSLKKLPDRSRRRQRAINHESHHAPGEMIDDGRCPPAEWPDLRQGKGKPGDPEAERRRYGRQIDVPEMIGVPGDDHALGLLGIMARSRPSPVAKHPANGRRG